MNFDSRTKNRKLKLDNSQDGRAKVKTVAKENLWMYKAICLFRYVGTYLDTFVLVLPKGTSVK